MGRKATKLRYYVNDKEVSEAGFKQRLRRACVHEAQDFEEEDLDYYLEACGVLNEYEASVMCAGLLYEQKLAEVEMSYIIDVDGKDFRIEEPEY